MEIGGYDTIIHTTTPKETCQEIMDFVRSNAGWREGTTVVEKDEGEDFFWYKDQDAHTSWNSCVGTENSMIYFIFDENQISLVTDKELTDIIRTKYPQPPREWDK